MWCIKSRTFGLLGYIKNPSFIGVKTYSTPSSLYHVFGLCNSATHQEIKEAFYRLSKVYHPDLTNDPNARSKFQELARAYEVLGNPTKRKDYDRGLILPTKGGSTNSERYTSPSVYDVGTDSFSAYYVKQYNRSLNEAWNKQASPEIIKTASEFQLDERNLLLTIYSTVLLFIFIGYAVSKYNEEDIQLIPKKST